MGKVFEQNVKNKFDSELKNEEILSRMLTLPFKSMLSYLVVIKQWILICKNHCQDGNFFTYYYLLLDNELAE